MENTANEVQTTPIENAVAEPQPQTAPVNIAPVTPVYNNNLVNTGVILGTAAFTLAAGTGVYFGIVKLSEIIKERLAKKNATQEVTEETSEEVESED